MESLQILTKKVYNHALKNNDNVVIKEFVDLLKKDKNILNEFFLIENIKNTKFSDEQEAKSFLNENLKTINSTYKIKNIKTDTTDLILNKLEESIDVVLKVQKLGGPKAYNIKKYNSAISTIITEMTNNVSVKKVEDNELSKLNEQEFNLFLKTFNKNLDKKVNTLEENKKQIVFAILNGDIKKQELCYENIKSDVKSQIATMYDVEVSVINEAIDKINNMKFNSDTLIDDLICLNDLVS